MRKVPDFRFLLLLLGSAVFACKPVGDGAGLSDGDAVLSPLDASFATGGLWVESRGSGRFSQFYAVTTQADGRIVAAGLSRNMAAAWYDQDILVARFLSDGRPDPSFGTGGRTLTSVGIGQDMARSVVVQPDGKIIVAGKTNQSSSYAIANASANDNHDFAAVRYLADGSLDTSFGTAGIVTYDFGGVGTNDAVHKVLLQADGKIILAGGSAAAGATSFALVRLLPDGTVDTGYGSGGVAQTTFESHAANLIVSTESGAVSTADGGVVLAGTYLVQVNSTAGRGWALAKFTSTGALDVSFGSGGTAVFGGEADVSSMVAQSDGKLLVVGGIASAPRLRRFESNGAVDAAFGTAGAVSLPATDGNGSSFPAVATLPNGKILVSYTTGAYQIGLVRLMSGGVLDSGFANGGKAILHGGGSAGLWGLAVSAAAAGGAYVVGGTTETAASSDSQLLLAKFRP